MTGPGLQGATERWESEEKLIAWIKNSQSLIKAGDPYAVKIFNEWDQVVMPAQLLQDDEIKNIIHYVDNYVPPVVAEVPGGEVSETAISWLSPSRLFMLIMGLVLLAIVFILSRILRTLRNLALEKQGLPIPPPLSFKQKYLNGPVIALASLAILAFLGFTAYDQAAALGRQQGYAPDQPIEFSHALHAGINGVDCQYCHSGARSGKSAVIPSANVCMNCHKHIEEGPEYGTEEIAKIYDHIDWDKETKTYGDDQKPIPWVKIHNLPDHVYFSHAQHVTAGKIECQTCHGDVENMEVVEQVETLGMGWCINCHRETEVQFASNDYYQIYEKFHDDIKNNKMDRVTVEDIGGLECQKCHY